ncbi:uncharacterized protein LOC122048741 [Zingiber officinale]|uniref:uncharacterized protein LOC122048741 n=1 Tax=Zingiber officinale TaxID=94328 RepID=UPI001C4AFC9A|nr:uncharacterized protein LOC122048741 [Zingiber officinale]
MNLDMEISTGVSQVTREGKYVQSDVPRQFGSQDGSSKTQVHALLSLLLHVCSFVIKNLRPGIQIAGSFKAAILILCCNTFHVAYSFCHVVYGLGASCDVFTMMFLMDRTLE